MHSLIRNLSTDVNGALLGVKWSCNGHSSTAALTHSNSQKEFFACKMTTRFGSTNDFHGVFLHNMDYPSGAMTQRVFLLQPAHHQLFPATSAMKKGRVAINKVFVQEQQFSAFSVNQILLIKGKERRNKSPPKQTNKTNETRSIIKITQTKYFKT